MPFPAGTSKRPTRHRTRERQAFYRTRTANDQQLTATVPDMSDNTPHGGPDTYPINTADRASAAAHWFKQRDGLAQSGAGDVRNTENEPDVGKHSVLIVDGQFALRPIVAVRTDGGYTCAFEVDGGHLVPAWVCDAAPDGKIRLGGSDGFDFPLTV